MSWTSFAASGIGSLAIIKAKTNSWVYQYIPEDHVRVAVRQLKLCRSTTNKWLQEKKIRLMELPSQSLKVKPRAML